MQIFVPDAEEESRWIRDYHKNSFWASLIGKKKQRKKSSIIWGTEVVWHSRNAELCKYRKVTGGHSKKGEDSKKRKIEEMDMILVFKEIDSVINKEFRELGEVK